MFAACEAETEKPKCEDSGLATVSIRKLRRLHPFVDNSIVRERESDENEEPVYPRYYGIHAASSKATTVQRLSTQAQMSQSASRSSATVDLRRQAHV